MFPVNSGIVRLVITAPQTPASFPPSIHRRAAPAVSFLVYRDTIAAVFHLPCLMVVSVGAPAPLIILASPTLPLWPDVREAIAGVSNQFDKTILEWHRSCGCELLWASLRISRGV